MKNLGMDQDEFPLRRVYHSACFLLEVSTPSPCPACPFLSLENK